MIQPYLVDSFHLRSGHFIWINSCKTWLHNILRKKEEDSFDNTSPVLTQSELAFVSDECTKIM